MGPSCLLRDSASESVDEGAGSSRMFDAHWGAMRLGSVHIDGGQGEEERPYNGAACFSGVRRVSLGASAPVDENPSAASRDAVTMYVPTMFTTAAGRPICLREKRVLDAKSPYWRLLSFAPEREAALAPVLSDSKGKPTTNRRADAGRHSSPLSDKTVGCTALHSATQGSHEAWVRPLRSSRLGEAWFHPQPLRAHSCPERFYSGSQGGVREEAPYLLPTFTGFCAANGRPFFALFPQFHECLVRFEGGGGHRSQ
ncbi:hypothetical protein ABL78_2290 [Leptomonas seymouri]|uniref:Uncharacterized protein n=1 Tax=Leptomonas seymouri TaxID=5684 RepID=A0A0N1PFD8_LEPSE|nr:hypothetical protein ABL78_2290 [Leptomonas seymouri]|eukprot:KPI88622.1 hypothetical protein ABL78_2290 [Leptomonas seymouri]